jgi:hypothetical protein
MSRDLWRAAVSDWLPISLILASIPAAVTLFLVSAG